MILRPAKNPFLLEDVNAASSTATALTAVPDKAVERHAMAQDRR
jgi:hypothetical protein